ncbi:hypothetical protein BT96DRAFT_970906 [Gymnopus androsaceus JB14]|uniref:MYND-type domain-containing protein n=1 Tax=Gymnopus androsaceus JB14 TaxID=1447944 RepID=A0A6A4IHS0_9AGAR|nr:hypothetical protein BT96DRAFT_970906 [Gymnopus androsaceus JB14]
MATDHRTELVKRYNALPIQPLAPSGRVPNVWHFDLRYIPISPPSHMLFLLQKESHFVATEILPLGKKVFESGLSYFPETAKQAALEICLGLMNSFITGFHGNSPTPDKLAPWKLTTDDRTLAKAVEEQFKSLGVNPDRCKVEYLNLTRFAHQQFDDVYKGMKGILGISDFVKAALTTPSAIDFSTAAPADPNFFSPGSSFVGLSEDEENSDELKGANMIMAYYHEFMNNEPLPVNVNSSSRSSDQHASRLNQGFAQIKALLETTTLKEVRKEADAGDAQQAVDTALRLRFGYDCTPDRTLSRDYLIKAAFNATASSQTRSMAHSMLIPWYILNRAEVRARYLFAAAYHADESIRLASEGNPISSASPAALIFYRNSFEPMTRDLKVPELLYHFKWISKASQERQAFMKLQKEAAERKMMGKPNRYRCANVGCGIEADRGKMLSQCSGKCDRDKKPSYCSRACQKAPILPQDWKTHKPFCQPGAPCSVIDTSITTGGISQNGSIRVPVHHNDGTTSLLESSTLDPEMLKKMGEIMTEGRNIHDGSEGSTLRTELFET